MLNSVEKENISEIFNNINQALRFAQGLPSAVMNTSVTNLRGFIYCEESSSAIEFREYTPLLKQFFGSYIFEQHYAEKAARIAKEILREGSKVPELDLFHVRAGDYLLEQQLYSEAVWPFFIWVSYRLRDMNFNKIEKKWYELLDLLQWYQSNDIRKKISIGENIIEMQNHIYKKFKEEKI